MADAKVIFICEQCAHARGNEEVAFPSGAVLRMCTPCANRCRLWLEPEDD